MTDASDLVDRRSTFIQRQVALDKGALNVRFRGRTPKGSTQVEDTSDFNRVTTRRRGDHHWGGVRFLSIAEKAMP